MTACFFRKPVCGFFLICRSTMKHNTFHFRAVCHACWAVVQAISNPVFAGDMIIQKEGVSTSFKCSWRVLFLSLKGWTTEWIVIFPFHPSARGPTFLRLFPCFSALSLSYISFPEFWSCTFTPGFHSGNVYIQFIQGLEFSLVHFASDAENSL